MPTTTYTIQMASKISGVGVHTIRAWEKRYKALVPERDSSGHRTYSKSDVEKLMLLSELCLLGYAISKVAGHSILELKELLRDLGKSEESFKGNEFDLVNDTKLTVDPAQSLPILMFALKNYKLDVISQELGKLKTLISPREFGLSIMVPLIESLQQIYLNHEFSPAQEQAARAVFKFHMGLNIYHQAEKKEKSAFNIVISGMEGDLGELSLGIVALLCNHYGFHYTYLGPDLGHDALGDIVRSLEANMIILGPTNVYNQMGKTYFQNYVEKLSSKLNTSVELVVAGKSDLTVDSLPSRRLVILKSLDAVDEFLSEKN